ncbi:MAG: hypothetical protein QG641_2217 [Candidatus Poribacteria bacterium]|nr:hypothetical protein [Candidatus Poribacteria bacterium]MDQ1328931.1 hypothetical protein [Candidatus Poribacteria bacterium]
MGINLKTSDENNDDGSFLSSLPYRRVVVDKTMNRKVLARLILNIIANIKN